MPSYLLYGSVIAFASGISVRSFLFIEARVLFLLSIIAALSMLASVAAPARFKYGVAGVGVCLLCFSLGAWRFESVQERYSADVVALSELEGVSVAIEGVIVRDPEHRESGTFLVVHTDTIEGNPYEAVVRIGTTDMPEAFYGDRVSIKGTLARPEAFESDLGRIFPYEEYLRAHGVTHVISFAHGEVLTPGGDWVPLRALYAFKHRFADAITELLPEPQAGFALGLLLGEKHGLGERLEEVFRTVGIIHIIVLSGYNLTIVAESLMALLRRILAPKSRIFVGALSIIAFAVMVGASSTVVRASLMALLVLFARATGRTYAALRALAVAGAAMLLFNPYILLYDPGFQFSFLATVGLILLCPLIAPLFSSVTARLGVREYLVSTIATQIMVTPLLLYSIGSVSLIAVVANLLILVVVPVAMLLTFVAGICGMLVGSFALVIAYPAYLVLSYMLATAEFLARVPYAHIAVPPFSFAYVVMAYGALAAVIGFWRFSARKKTPDAPKGASGVFSSH